jgi:heptosyltransferase-2
MRVGLDFRGSGFPLSLKVPDKKSNVADKEQCAVEDYLDIVKILGVQENGTHLDFYLTSEGKACVENFLDKAGVSSRDLVIGIFPGGCDNPAEKVFARRWPVQKYAQLADILISGLSAKVIALGDNKDSELISQMFSLMKEKAINGCNIGNLNTFGHLLKRCSLLITNDSLPMHLALSLNIPTVAPFGPTNSKVYLTPDNCSLFVPIQSSLECSPCYWKERFKGCKKYDSPKCMDAISTSEVLGAIKKLLQSNYRKDLFKAISLPH